MGVSADNEAMQEPFGEEMDQLRLLAINRDRQSQHQIHFEVPQ